jgi:biotin carboxylase
VLSSESWPPGLREALTSPPQGLNSRASIPGRTLGTVLMVGAGLSQTPAIRRARDLGFGVVAVDGDGRAPGLALASYAEVHDFSDLDAVVAIGRRHAVDGVLTVASDRAVPVAAAVAERLRLPGIGTAVAARMTHKVTMREGLAAAGVPQPAFARVTTHGSARSAVERIGLPAVLKPANSGGQRGLSLVERPDQIAPAVDAALSFSPTREAIVERFAPGSELNGILVVRSGEPTLLTLSDRLRPTGPGFGVGWIHAYPAGIDEDVHAQATRVAEEAVRALGLRDGIAFPQLIVNGDRRVQLIEIAARVPAGQMADLVRVATGIDLIEIALRQCTGERIADSLVTRNGSQPLAIRFFTAAPGVLPVGRVRSIDGLDEVRAAPGVVQTELYFGVGDVIRPVQVDADRLGYVLAVGKSRGEALELAQAATTHLRVRADPRPLPP